MDNNNEISIKQYALFSEIALTITKIDLTSDFLTKCVRQILAANNKGVKISNEEIKLFSEKYNDLKELIDNIIQSNELHITDKNIV
jgi:hypothetical protein